MKISVTRHRVGLNMGDHGETVITAHEVAPDEDVAELAVRLLIEDFHKGRPNQQSFDNFLTIRLVEEAPKAEAEPSSEHVPWEDLL